MNKKYQVFVSSTYTDLKEERLAVISCLLDNNCIPIGMEQFRALPMSQWDYITKMIDDSDYYVLIIAGRYGSIDKETNISYTEKEFEYAQEKNIPILAFLHEDPRKLNVDNYEENDKGRKKLSEFREKVKNSNRLVDFYSNIDDLKSKVATSINKAIIYTPRPGWIRADQIKNANDDNTYSREQVKRMIVDMKNEFDGKIEQLKSFIPKIEGATEEDIKKLFDSELEKRTAKTEEIEEALNKYFENKMATISGGNVSK